MKQAAIRAAWSKGLFDHTQLLRRWEATVTTEVWRRAARMVKACFPKLRKLGAALVEDDPAAQDERDDDDAEGDGNT